MIKKSDKCSHNVEKDTTPVIATFNSSELAYMVSIVSKCEPDKYASPGVKAIIYKCKGLIENSKTHIGIKFKLTWDD